MRAMVFNQYGSPEVLEPADLPMPQPEAGEVLIAVRAAAVNPADGKWRSGMFEAFAPVQFPHVVGYDVAGIVEQGEGFAKGTRVVAVLDTYSKGGYAEFAKVLAANVVAIPDAMSFETAAAIPTAGLTGLQAVEQWLDVQPGQRVLVTGALGAVGQVAVHYAQERGAKVIAAVRPAQAAAARALGVAEVAPLGEVWSGAPFDCVIDTLGGELVVELCGHLAPGGRIITVATTPIPTETLPATPEFLGVTPDGKGLARLVDAVAAGALPMQIGRVLPLASAAEAQTAVEAGGTGGKVILTP